MTISQINPALATGDRRPLSLPPPYPCYVHVLRVHIVIVQFDKDGKLQMLFVMSGVAAYIAT